MSRRQPPEPQSMLSVVRSCAGQGDTASSPPGASHSENRTPPVTTNPATTSVVDRPAPRRAPIAHTTAASVV